MAVGGPSRFDSLSPRDRKLLAGLVVFVGLVMVGFLVLTLKGMVDDKASRVRAAKDNLEVLIAMEERYLEAATVIESSEERLKRSGSERLAPFVERVALSADVRDSLQSVDELGTETIGNVDQQRYKIVLKKVPLSGALDFLYELETEGYPVSVERADIRTIYVSGERMVNLTLEVVTLSIKEGS